MTHSNGEYEAFFRRAPGLLCILNGDGSVRSVSAACKELLDFPAEGGSLVDLAHPEDVERLRGALTEAGSGEFALLRELRLRCRVGAHRSFRCQLRGDRDSSALFAVLSEHEGSSLERRQFRLLVEAITDMIGIADFNGQTMYINPSGCEMLGYTLEEGLACNIMQYVPAHMHARYQEEYLPTVMREGKWTGEVELMHRDGTVIPAIQSIVILPDETGRPEAIATLAHDITRLKRLEEALRRAIQELSTPMIQVWEGVLALPIIGVVDSDRATQMMQSLLEAIQSKRCKIAVLDLTGATNLDTATIDHLFRMIRAASLLGSRCVVSGMSPITAQTVAGLGIDMSGLQAFRSLEEALRYAMKLIARK